MDQLFLTKKRNLEVTVYSLTGNNTWKMVRMPERCLEKVHITMAFESGGWQVKDGGKVTLVPRTPKAEQSCDTPPLGDWQEVAGKKEEFSLSQLPPSNIDPVPSQMMELPFIHIDYREESAVAKVSFIFQPAPIVDEVLEELLEKFKTIILNLSQRPEMTLIMKVSLQQAATPAIRHAKRLIAFSQALGPSLFLIGRGLAVILKPRGLLGHALLNIVKMIQRAAPAPWPECIVPTEHQADEFLAALVPKPIPGISKPEAGVTVPLDNSPSGDGTSLVSQVEATAPTSQPGSQDGTSLVSQVEATAPTSQPGSQDKEKAMAPTPTDRRASPKVPPNETASHLPLADTTSRTSLEDLDAKEVVQNLEPELEDVSVQSNVFCACGPRYCRR